jgi:hypothetical protein
MIRKILPLAIILSLCLALLPAHATARYLPRQGDYFTYYEAINVGSGTGSYTGYTEQTIYNGMEKMNTVYSNGTVAAHYNYSATFTNSTRSTSWKWAGNFTWSSTTFYYVKGTDNQTGYVNPSVWFYMDNTTSQGFFELLNTQMSVQSTSYSYRLVSQNRYVKTIQAQGTSSYHRNDVYGSFTAQYTWTTYFDPSTGYIVGYDYNEQDTNSGASFTYTDTFYVTSTSYALTAGSPPTDLTLYIAIFALAFLVFLFAIVAWAVRRSRRLPTHPAQQPYGAAPPTIDLTPKQQPPVQQIVIKEVVKVKCKYCGALIDGTVQACPFCGAPRT